MSVSYMSQEDEITGWERTICVLSCVRDCSNSFTGSPSLPDKYRHHRELMMLLPAHRDRPSSAMYPAAIMENGQVKHVCMCVCTCMHTHAPAYMCVSLWVRLDYTNCNTISFKTSSYIWGGSCFRHYLQEII